MFNVSSTWKEASGTSASANAEAPSLRSTSLELSKASSRCSFKVRTTCLVTERPVHSLNLDREARYSDSLHLVHWFKLQWSNGQTSRIVAPWNPVSMPP